MKQEFRGIWIPAKVWFLFLKKEISASELHLLATIDALVTEEHGCYASNKYLGKILGIRPDYVARLIGKLKAKQLIKQVRFDGRRRYLETEWSRVDLDRASKAALDNNPPPITPTELSNNKVNTSGGFGFEMETEETDDIHHEPFDIASARQLWETLPLKKRNRKKLPKTWSNHFRLLRAVDQVSKEEIEIILDWYSQNHQDQWTPKCYTAKTFRNKFDRLVAARERVIHDNPEAEVSEEALKIVERLVAKQWPKGSEKMLPVFVQLSLEEYSVIYQQIIEQEETIRPEEETDIQNKMKKTRDKKRGSLISGTECPLGIDGMGTWRLSVSKRNPHCFKNK